jgi:hypothetical protein
VHGVLGNITFLLSVPINLCMYMLLYYSRGVRKVQAMFSDLIIIIISRIAQSV